MLLGERRGYESASGEMFHIICRECSGAFACALCGRWNALCDIIK